MRFSLALKCGSRQANNSFGVGYFGLLVWLAKQTEREQNLVRLQRTRPEYFIMTNEELVAKARELAKQFENFEQGLPVRLDTLPKSA